MKKNTIKRIAAGAAAAALMFSLAACGSGQTEGGDGNGDQTELKKITFVLDWTPNTNHTGVYAAQALGYYKDAGLDVEIQQPPEDGANIAVATGKAQFGVGFQETIGPALTADDPLPITAVASIIDHNTSGMISMKEKNITSFKDLEGKTYASWDTPSEKEIIQQCMEDQGGDYAKLKTVPNSGADALSLMQTGDVDVVWVYEAWDVMMAEVAGLDYNFIKFSDASPVLDFYTPVIIANNDFLKEDPETARAFLAATARGYEYAIANPKEAGEILCQADSTLSPELVQKSQAYLADQYQAEKTAWGTIDKDRWTAFNQWMFEKGLIPAELGSEGFTNDYLSQ